MMQNNSCMIGYTDVLHESQVDHILSPRLQSEIHELTQRASAIMTELSNLNRSDCAGRIREIVNIIESLHPGDGKYVLRMDEFVRFNAWLQIRREFNRVIGWAIPTQSMIVTIAEWFNNWKNRHPSARIIDMGAGSGAISLLLSEYIDPANIIAVDNGTFKYAREYFDIVRCDSARESSAKYITDCFRDGTYTTDDVLFIAWGYGLESVVDQFIEFGTKCIILQGEDQGGATYPSAYHLEEYDNACWHTETILVIASCKMSHDYLTLNTRID